MYNLLTNLPLLLVVGLVFAFFALACLEAVGFAFEALSVAFALGRFEALVATFSFPLARFFAVPVLVKSKSERRNQHLCKCTLASITLYVTTKHTHTNYTCTCSKLVQGLPCVFPSNSPVVQGVQSPVSNLSCINFISSSVPTRA